MKKGKIVIILLIIILIAFTIMILRNLLIFNSYGNNSPVIL